MSIPLPGRLERRSVRLPIRSPTREASALVIAPISAPHFGEMESKERVSLPRRCSRSTSKRTRGRRPASAKNAVLSRRGFESAVEGRSLPLGVTGQSEGVTSALRTAAITASVVSETLRISVPTVWQGAWGRLDVEVCNRRLETWAARLVERVGIELTVRGEEHVSGSRAFLVMSNHQSHFDIPVLYRALPLPMRMVVKKELFRIPVWSSAMRAAGFIEVDRKHGRQAYEKLAQAGQHLLESGMSLWISPEGTRSVDGRLLPFKRGGFRLALAAGLPILPVTIAGTRQVHQKGTRSIRCGRAVEVIVHAPIETKSLAGSARSGADGENPAVLDELLERTRLAIAGPL